MFIKSTVELIDSMGDDRRACEAARVSLLNDAPDGEGLSARDERLLEFLMRERHTSPFEHSVATFRICAPLPVVAQIMRHRTFSYNQASRRYTSDDIEFLDVTEWRRQGAKNLQCSDGALDREESAELSSAYITLCERSLELYEWALERGCSREQARFMLPQGLMARFWMTGNLHNYLRFLLLRDDAHAQGECREVATEIRRLLTERFPATLSLFARLQTAESAHAGDRSQA
jgi:thymidylate synthase (FAD)